MNKNLKVAVLTLIALSVMAGGIALYGNFIPGVAAAGKDQFAAEVEELGHGVFTYAILEGLSGGADGTPNDGVVTIRELLSFVESELPEISMKHKSQAQFPVVDSRGQNFPLVALSGSHPNSWIPRMTVFHQFSMFLFYTVSNASKSELFAKSYQT